MLCARLPQDPQMSNNDCDLVKALSGCKCLCTEDGGEFHSDAYAVDEREKGRHEKAQKTEDRWTPSLGGCVRARACVCACVCMCVRVCACVCACVCVCTGFPSGRVGQWKLIWLRAGD